MFSFFVYFYIAIIFLIIIGVSLFLWKKAKSKEQLEKSLEFVLYEISLPRFQPRDGAQEQDFKKLVSVMEQFYGGMVAVDPYFVLEIGLPYFGDQIVFYCSVPKKRGGIFEKQVQGLYPEASVIIKKDDYNIFRPQGFSLATNLRLQKNSVLPIKTYDKFDADPLQVILNTFSKLQREGEGAALQIVISSSTQKGDSLIKKIRSAIGKIRQGKSMAEALKGENFVIDIGKILLSNDTAPPKEDKPKPIDEEVVRLLDAKSSRRVLPANIRLIVSAESTDRAETIQKELESAFLQFHEASGNEFYFERPKGGALQRMFYNFSFRLPDYGSMMLLNTGELSSVFHFPSKISGSAAPQLKSVKTLETAPPMDLPTGGLLLGKNVYRGEEKNIFMTDEDRRRHFYTIGQTGTGKTNFMKTMILQDIEAGRGVCFIDPHGADIKDILAKIPPERLDDVIYFDPANIERPMGLNMMEFDPKRPDLKTFVVDELLGIFNKLYNMSVAGGPAFEQYFRNSALLVMDDPESGNTLLEITRVLTNKEFRTLKLAKCKNPIVASFWREMAEKTTGDTSLANMAPYISNKFDNFLSNEIMRPIVLQEKSSFNFREIMDNKKIFLVNLSKGRLGDLNSYLLGLIIVGKFLMAAMSRDDSDPAKMPDFYLYIDEFQNVTTDSISKILSEARKYKLCLIIAHQFIGQLEDKIKNAVFGNVGSMAVFRIGAEDAQFIEKFYEPTFKAQDFVNIDNYNAYLRLLVNGQVNRPFSLQALEFKKGDQSMASKISEISSLKYGRPREEIEAEIMAKYQK